ncbi:hypothetical protein MMPV_008044 [Pyropia vietnamensis]
MKGGGNGGGGGAHSLLSTPGGGAEKPVLIFPGLFRAARWEAFQIDRRCRARLYRCLECAAEAEARKGNEPAANAAINAEDVVGAASDCIGRSGDGGGGGSGGGADRGSSRCPDVMDEDDDTDDLARVCGVAEPPHPPPCVGDRHRDSSGGGGVGNGGDGRHGSGDPHASNAVAIRHPPMPRQVVGVRGGRLPPTPAPVHPPTCPPSPRSLKPPCPHTTACAICLEALHPLCLVRRMPCSDKHVFHSRCVLKWLDESPVCALCKEVVVGVLSPAVEARLAARGRAERSRYVARQARAVEAAAAAAAASAAAAAASEEAAAATSQTSSATTNTTTVTVTPVIAAPGMTGSGGGASAAGGTADEPASGSSGGSGSGGGGGSWGRLRRRGAGNVGWGARDAAPAPAAGRPCPPGAAADVGSGASVGASAPTGVAARRRHLRWGGADGGTGGGATPSPSPLPPASPGSRVSGAPAAVPAVPLPAPHARRSGEAYSFISHDVVRLAVDFYGPA